MRGTMVGMNDVKDSFEPIPSGDYYVEIIEIGEKTTKNLDPMMNLKLQVIYGEHKGHVLYDNIIISDNQDSPGWNIRWRAKQFLKAIGEQHKGDSFPWDSDHWLNRKVKVTLGIEEITAGKYLGDTRNNVIKYVAITDEEAKKDKALEQDIPF